MRVKRNNFLSEVKRWDGGGAGDGASAPGTTPPGNEPPAGGEGGGATPPNYDELIKTDTALQSWLDKKVNAATTTAVQKALEKERLLADEKATEAEKLAKMSAAEKQEYQIKKAKEEIAKLKADMEARNLKEQALEIAAEKEVPAALVNLLPFSQLKAEEVAATIDSIKKAYDQAVSNGIAQALSGAGAPSGAGKTTPAAVTMEGYKKMSYADRLKFANEHPEEYEKLIKKGA